MALVEAAAALVTTEIVAKLATKQITDKAAADVEAPQVIIKTPAFNSAKKQWTTDRFVLSQTMTPIMILIVVSPSLTTTFSMSILEPSLIFCPLWAPSKSSIPTSASKLLSLLFVANYLLIRNNLALLLL